MSKKSNKTKTKTRTAERWVFFLNRLARELLEIQEIKISSRLVGGFAPFLSSPIRDSPHNLKKKTFSQLGELHMNLAS